MSGRFPWQDSPLILDQKLAATGIGSYSDVLVRDALQAALLDGVQGKETTVLSNKLEVFLNELRSAGETVECSWDATVHTNTSGETLALENAGAISTSSFGARLYVM